MGRGGKKSDKKDVGVAAEEAILAGSVQCLPEGGLSRLLQKQRPLTIKLGVDPTAPDIHLGHYVVLKKLRDFQDLGHKVVLIIGDFTSRVGDPTGRSVLRPVLSEEEIKENAQTYASQVFRVLDRDKTEIRYNSEWLEMPASQILELLSSATLSSILSRKDFQKRLKNDQPISMLEMIYPLLQGYDSVAIESDIEIGGTDQTFNLLFARDVQASYDKKGQVILTMPILPGLDGEEKMSKSKKNYISFEDSAEEMFGKIMSIPDSSLEEYWQIVFREKAPALPPNESKRLLAKKVVGLFHDSPEETEKAFDSLFVKKEVPKDIPSIDIESEGHLPALLEKSFGITRSEARRLIRQGGVKLDGESVSETDFDAKSLIGKTLQAGKRRFVRLQ